MGHGYPFSMHGSVSGSFDVSNHRVKGSSSEHQMKSKRKASSYPQEGQNTHYVRRAKIHGISGRYCPGHGNLAAKSEPTLNARKEHNNSRLKKVPLYAKHDAPLQQDQQKELMKKTTHGFLMNPDGLSTGKNAACHDPSSAADLRVTSSNLHPGESSGIRLFLRDFSLLDARAESCNWKAAARHRSKSPWHAHYTTRSGGLLRRVRRMPLPTSPLTATASLRRNGRHTRTTTKRNPNQSSAQQNRPTSASHPYISLNRGRARKGSERQQGAVDGFVR